MWHMVYDPQDPTFTNENKSKERISISFIKQCPWIYFQVLHQQHNTSCTLTPTLFKPISVIYSTLETILPERQLLHRFQRKRS